MNRKLPRVWVVSEIYYPEETSTGYLLTCTAEGIAKEFNVSVLCRQVVYANSEKQFQNYEKHNDVHIYRCWGTNFDKNRLLLRLINIMTITLSVSLMALFKLRKNDYVFVVTNPPLLPFIVKLVCWLRRIKFILIVHDVYPEALVVTGLRSPTDLSTKFMRWLTILLYRNSERIVVLGRDMQKLIERKLPSGDKRVVLIQNWADLDIVKPMPREKSQILIEHDLTDKFVVQYAGNMGRTHGLEDLVSVAHRLNSERSDIHFLLIGSGAKKQWLEESFTRCSLSNFTMLGNRPRCDQINFLNACDISLISFIPGMAGISVPSRMYNVMASGKPIIAVADASSELSQVVKEEGIGWVVAPGDVDALEEFIIEASQNPGLLSRMGRRARLAAESRYSLERANLAYINLVKDLTCS